MNKEKPRSWVKESAKKLMVGSLTLAQLGLPAKALAENVGNIATTTHDGVMFVLDNFQEPETQKDLLREEALSLADTDGDMKIEGPIRVKKNWFGDRENAVSRGEYIEKGSQADMYESSERRMGSVLVSLVNNDTIDSSPKIKKLKEKLIAYGKNEAQYYEDNNLPTPKSIKDIEYNFEGSEKEAKLDLVYLRMGFYHAEQAGKKKGQDVSTALAELLGEEYKSAQEYAEENQDTQRAIIGAEYTAQQLELLLNSLGGSEQEKWQKLFKKLGVDQSRLFKIGFVAYDIPYKHSAKPRTVEETNDAGGYQLNEYGEKNSSINTKFTFDAQENILYFAPNEDIATYLNVGAGISTNGAKDAYLSASAGGKVQLLPDTSLSVDLTDRLNSNWEHSGSFRIALEKEFEKYSLRAGIQGHALDNFNRAIEMFLKGNAFVGANVKNVKNDWDLDVSVYGGDSIAGITAMIERNDDNYRKILEKIHTDITEAQVDSFIKTINPTAEVNSNMREEYKMLLANAILAKELHYKISGVGASYGINPNGFSLAFILDIINEASLQKNMRVGETANNDKYRQFLLSIGNDIKKIRNAKSFDIANLKVEGAESRYKILPDGYIEGFFPKSLREKGRMVRVDIYTDPQFRNLVKINEDGTWKLLTGQDIKPKILSTVTQDGHIILKVFFGNNLSNAQQWDGRYSSDWMNNFNQYNLHKKEGADKAGEMPQPINASSNTSATYKIDNAGYQDKLTAYNTCSKEIKATNAEIQAQIDQRGRDKQSIGTERNLKAVERRSLRAWAKNQFASDKNFMAKIKKIEKLTHSTNFADAESNTKKATEAFFKAFPELRDNSGINKILTDQDILDVLIDERMFKSNEASFDKNNDGQCAIRVNKQKDLITGSKKAKWGAIIMSIVSKFNITGDTAMKLLNPETALSDASEDGTETLYDGTEFVSSLGGNFNLMNVSEITLLHVKKTYTIKGNKIIVITTGYLRECLNPAIFVQVKEIQETLELQKDTCEEVGTMPIEPTEFKLSGEVEAISDDEAGIYDLSISIEEIRLALGLSFKSPVETKKVQTKPAGVTPPEEPKPPVDPPKPLKPAGQNPPQEPKPPAQANP